ncbi:MAG TPA: lysophospholipid acyltransferase family protein [Pyrinomonadaceae bacterium]|nr:lysophospholipid acyltransferase family protein [Pyrinomonadaceae bacterium]
MSEAAKPLGGDGPKGQAGEPRALPQWVVDSLLRPATRVVSRTFWRISFRGREHIPAEGGLVIAANHQTYFDPFWISVAFDRPIRYLAWNEAFKWPLAGKPLELLGAWPLALDRGNPTAYRRSLQWLRGGGAVMIFPEGARAGADGELARFKTGAARLALEAGVPVLPVTIRGGEHVWPRGRRWPRLGRVEIVFHPARRLAPLPGEDARRCAQRETEDLAAVIRSELK